MRYFPAFLDLVGQSVLLVGGGETAARKLRLLRKAGGQSVTARKYLVAGDMERELWYGPDDTWLKMRFDKDGAKITFTLQ